jgi:hypothetical protein
VRPSAWCLCSRWVCRVFGGLCENSACPKRRFAWPSPRLPPTSDRPATSLAPLNLSLPVCLSATRKRYFLSALSSLPSVPASLTRAPTGKQQQWASFRKDSKWQAAGAAGACTSVALEANNPCSRSPAPKLALRSESCLRLCCCHYVPAGLHLLACCCSCWPGYAWLRTQQRQLQQAANSPHSVWSTSKVQREEASAVPAWIAGVAQSACLSTNSFLEPLQAVFRVCICSQASTQAFC